MAVITSLILATAIAYSPGSDSCGSWVDVHRRAKDIEWFAQEAWLNGYISGINRLTVNKDDDVLSGTDRMGASVWLTNYCEQNPLDTIERAAWALVKAARAKQ